MWLRCGLGVARIWLGCRSDVFSDVVEKVWQKLSRGNVAIYLLCSGPLLENDLERPENRYGRHGLLVFSPYLLQGWMEPELPSEDYLLFLSWVVVVLDLFQLPVKGKMFPALKGILRGLLK